MPKTLIGNTTLQHQETLSRYLIDQGASPIVLEGCLNDLTLIQNPKGFYLQDVFPDEPNLDIEPKAYTLLYYTYQDSWSNTLKWAFSDDPLFLASLIKDYINPENDEDLFAFQDMMNLLGLNPDKILESM